MIDDRDVWGTALTAHYSFGDYVLTSITAYRETEFGIVIDGDHTAVEANVQTSSEDQNQFSQELRIDSAADRLSWTLGLYYFTQEYARNSSFDNAGFALGLPFDVNLSFGNSEKTNAYAIFGNSSYDLSDRLSVSLGLRYTYETKSMDYAQKTLPFDLGEQPFVDIAPFSDRHNWDAWSPSLVFSYAWHENLRTYAKLVRGFKSGGFNAFLSASATSTDFDPEYITAWEIGLKSVFMDNRVMFNIAGFYQDYTDIQNNIQDPVTGESIVSNEDELASLGFEIDMTMRLVRDLDITASLGYTEVQKQEGPTPAGPPKLNGSLSVQYRFSLSERLEAKIRSDWFYRSGFHSTQAHIFHNPASVLLNIRAGIEMPSSNWGVYLWARNLTDKTIFSNTVPAIPIRSNLEPPRTYGVEFKLSF